MNTMNYELQKLSQQWQLSNVRSFTHIAMPNNYVVIAYSNVYGRDVVLKIGPKKVIDQEIQALQYFQGDACVKLLAFNCKFSDINSALLLEYVQPGISLKDLFLQRKPEDVSVVALAKSEESIRIFAGVVKKLHAGSKKYDGTTIQTAAQRLNFLHTFQSKNEDLVRLLSQTAKLADTLVTTQGKQYLLHGDLHHENILQRGDTWVIIDPQGVVGELEFEVGAFIRNPLFELLDQPNLEQLMLHRFERLSQFLNLDKQRIIDWSFVQAVLAACFTEENQNEQGQNYFIIVAELIAKL